VLGKVTATRYTDRVQVRLVSGQSAADFAKCADNPAQGFGALLCRVRSARSSALTEDDIDEIVRSVEQPGGTRAILEMYRARQLDADQNRPHYSDPISCRCWPSAPRPTSGTR
jgi:hypothetical protein